MKTFNKITLLGILSVFLILFLASCASAPSTPKINLIENAEMGMEMELNHPAPKIHYAAFSPDGRYALSSSGTPLRLWDVKAGKMVRQIQGKTNMDGPNPVAFSPDGKYIISASDDDLGLKLFDVETGVEVRAFKSKVSMRHSNDRPYVSFSPDGRYVLDADCRLWDVSAGHIVRIFRGGGWCPSPAFSSDAKYALLPTSGGLLGIFTTFGLFDVSTGEEVRTFKLRSSYFTAGAFSPDGRYIISGSGHSNGTLTLWDISTGKEIRTFGGHKRQIISVAFSPDSKYVLSSGLESTFSLWDIETGKEIRTFTGHDAGGGYSIFIGGGVSVSSVASRLPNIPLFGWVFKETVGGAVMNFSAVHTVSFSPDGKYVLSGSNDASTRIWDAATGKEIVTMVGFKDGEWLVITSEGYYNASGKGAQYLNVKVGEQKYDMNLFYDVFYRPDIVAAKLRGEDIKDLITITMQDAIKSPPPVVEISPITTSPTYPKAKVCYNVKSTGGGIGEIRLFHNGKLIESDGYYKEAAKTVTEKTQLAKLSSKVIYEDMRSVKIKEKGIETGTNTTKPKGEAFNDCKEIDAISGENEISITAFNKNNTVQSYMQTAKFTSTIKQEEPHLYILSIGIDQYKDNTINLKYAVKDSKDIKEKILKQAETLYKPENIHHIALKDIEATKSNITAKINVLSQKIKPTDSFILFVAGHGALLQNQYYMLTHEYDGKVNENSLISSNEIVEISKKIKSLSQLFIFDTCHAGGVDYIVSGLYDARMSVLAKKMGLHIYASANSKEAAMDGYQGNGLFTYTLLDGLNNNKNADKNKDNKISLTELGEYSKASTTEISKKIGHQQTPLIINFGKDNPVYNLR